MAILRLKARILSFDNVAFAIFSASSGYYAHRHVLFACTEWIEDAFNGKEPHDIYSTA